MITITIRTKNFNIDEDIRTYINRRFEKLDKLIKDYTDKDWEEKKSSAELFLDVERETRHHSKGFVFCAMAKINLPKVTIQTQAESDRVDRAIDELKDKFIAEVKKYQKKSMDKNRKEERRGKEEIRS